MSFHAGDTVMHWTYGLGQVLRKEVRALSGSKMLYYAVQMGVLTVWVPADDNLDSRLRSPTSQSDFKKLLHLLSAPGEPLPDDRHERKIRLLALLRDGRAESLCRVIRDLCAYRHVRSLNDNDQTLLKQAQNALLGEWGFVLSVTPAQAQIEMQRLLAIGSPEKEE
jgi:RNA polymerase-interacting CarD/CdnL/TRCF family regulator